MDLLALRASSRSPLLTGSGAAARPSGPLVVLIGVPAFIVVGQLVGVLTLSAALGTSPVDVAGAELGLVEQLVFTLSFGYVALLLAVWLRWKERRPLVTLGFWWSRSSGVAALAGSTAAGAAMSVFVLTVVVLAGSETRVSPAFTVAAIGGIVLALVGYIVQATVEEALFRGFLLQSINRKWGLTAAILIQAGVFTGMHGINPNTTAISLIVLFLLAILLAVWAVAEGGLWGVCAFHAVWNWCQGNVYGIEVSGVDITTSVLETRAAASSPAVLTGGGYGAEGSVIIAAMLVIAVSGVLVLRRRARLRSNQ